MGIRKRNEIPKEYTWATEDLYPSDEAFYEDLEELKKLPAMIASYRGRLGESGETLLEFERRDEETSLKLDRAGQYAMRKADEDTANSVYQEMKSKLLNVWVTIGASAAFVTPELIAIPDETLEGFYRAVPALEKYRRALDRVRAAKPHTLSEKEEALLAQASAVRRTASSTYDMLSDADLRFPDVSDSKGDLHTLTQGTYIPYMQTSDRTLRKNAFEALYGTFSSHRNTFASLLEGQVNQLKFGSQARGYASTLEAALTPREVPVPVYHGLIEAVHGKMDLMYRYMALRKKLMKLDELHMYDIYAPILAESDEVIPFEEAKKIVLEALAPLGEDYVAVVKKAFESRWIDVYENEGKASGAYSSGGLPHPFVLLNHHDTLDSMFTLAHEMGHAMHSYLSTSHQPTVYSDYVIFVAEVASTCNEALLMQYLLKKETDRRRRAALINHFLEQFRTTLYRQTMFAEFEMKINALSEQGTPLTADTLCNVYYDLNKLYYGEGMVVDPAIAIEWARIPHFYMNFYVFQYATGFSAAMALSDRILHGGDQAVRDYLGFLSGGCSADPITLLKGAGVDMTTPAPVLSALDVFEKLLGELEELME